MVETNTRVQDLQQSLQEYPSIYYNANKQSKTFSTFQLQIPSPIPAKYLALHREDRLRVILIPRMKYPLLSHPLHPNTFQIANN